MPSAPTLRSPLARQGVKVWCCSNADIYGLPAAGALTGREKRLVADASDQAADAPGVILDVYRLYEKRVKRSVLACPMSDGRPAADFIGQVEGAS